VEKILEGFVQDVQGLYADELLAILLYGSAATGEHVAGRSDINTAIVLRHLTPALLRQAAGRLRSWRRLGFATPMFFDPEYVHASLDVFAIEFLDMQERHRVLWGADLFADLSIGRANLRFQCEQELRGKLLRLRQSYVESAHVPGELERILGVAMSSLVVLARTLLRLGGADPKGGAEAILERVQVRFGASSESLRKAWQLKRGELRMTGSNLEGLYQEVLREVDGLVRVVDAFPT
jgi:hypothetical protein